MSGLGIMGIIHRYQINTICLTTATAYDHTLWSDEYLKKGNNTGSQLIVSLFE